MLLTGYAEVVNAVNKVQSNDASEKQKATYTAYGMTQCKNLMVSSLLSSARLFLDGSFDKGLLQMYHFSNYFSV